MSDARPSGPQTTVCHDNHRRTTRTQTQTGKTTVEQEGTKGGGWLRARWEESCVSSLSPEGCFILTLGSFHTAGAQTHSQFSKFPPLRPCSIIFFLSFLFTADLPCFCVLRSLGCAEGGEKRLFQSFSSLVSFAPLCWKIERNRHQNHSALSSFSFYAHWRLPLKVSQCAVFL